MPVHWKWNVLQIGADLNTSANKTHRFSASSLLCSSTQLLRCSLKDCHTAQIPRIQDIFLPELLPTFHAQETCFHQQWEEFIGQGFQSCWHGVQRPSLGCAPGHPASHHPERSARNPVFPLLNLATGLRLVASCGPGYVTSAAWGATYPESRAVICPCNFMLEYYEIGQK